MEGIRMVFDRRTRKIFGCYLAAGLALALVVGGCAPAKTDNGPGDKTTPVAKGKPFNIAIVTWPGYGPLFVAKEKGFFGDLDVEFQVIDDTAPRHAAFKSGAADMIAETVDSFASGAPTYGMPAEAVYKTDDSNGADGLVVDKSVTSISDLKGKKVALPVGMPSHFLMLQLLKQSNMTSKDINIVNMDPESAGTAFGAGKVQAAVTWEPFLTMAAQKGGGRVLLNSHMVYGYIVDIMVVSKKTATERADDIQKIVNGHFLGLQYMQQHPDECNKIIADHLKGLQPDDVKAMLSTIDMSDPADNKKFFSDDTKGTPNFATLFEMAGQDWVNEKLIDKAFDPKDSFTTQFVDAYNGPEVKSYAGPAKITPEEITAAKQTAKPVMSLPVPLHFATGKYDLTAEHYKVLNPVGVSLLAYPDFVVRIVGHTDNVGDPASNKELSLKRAQAVATYFNGQFGLGGAQVVVEGAGEDNPVASNSTEEGRAKNRRVQFELLHAPSPVEKPAPPAPPAGK
jgi:NitT/TauT family transport system substrate-binding protein